jgi:hypothetical protein
VAQTVGWQCFCGLGVVETADAVGTPSAAKRRTLEVRRHSSRFLILPRSSPCVAKGSSEESSRSMGAEDETMKLDQTRETPCPSKVQ